MYDEFERDEGLQKMLRILNRQLESIHTTSEFVRGYYSNPILAQHACGIIEEVINEDDRPEDNQLAIFYLISHILEHSGPSREIWERAFLSNFLYSVDSVFKNFSPEKQAKCVKMLIVWRDYNFFQFNNEILYDLYCNWTRNVENPPLFPQTRIQQRPQNQTVVLKLSELLNEATCQMPITDQKVLEWKNTASIAIDKMKSYDDNIIDPNVKSQIQKSSTIAIEHLKNESINLAKSIYEISGLIEETIAGMKELSNRRMENYITDFPNQ